MKKESFRTLNKPFVNFVRHSELTGSFRNFLQARYDCTKLAKVLEKFRYPLQILHTFIMFLKFLESIKMMRHSYHLKVSDNFTKIQLH